MKMATAILQSQDCSRNQLRHQALAPPASLDPSATATAGSFRSRRRKRSPVGFQANRKQVENGRSMVVKLPSQNHLVVGQVKILKRGEGCNFGGAVVDANQKGQRANPKPKARGGGRKEQEVDLGLCSTDRIGPEPDLVQRQIKVSADGVYAGSAIFASPPPSSLPLPGFLEKHGAATNDLRRILRLDLF